ncbi:MAG TPA: hypothetical protein VE821_03965, partial [Pyrinomonadaceae bacterium]|nr:hypothetical protein [Pyrinomonadaceae bacterium]
MVYVLAVPVSPSLLRDNQPGRRQWDNDSDERKAQSDEFNSALITLHSALLCLTFRELEALA